MKTDIEERLIDWGFEKYVEERIDPADPIQAEKEDAYTDTIRMLSIGGVPLEMIEEMINQVLYLSMRAGYHAGFKAAQGH